MGISTGQLLSLKLSLRQILFSASYCIHCLVSNREGLGTSRFIVGISNILKFGVYRAYIERDTAIQKLKKYTKKYTDVRTMCPASHTSLRKF